MHATGGLFVEVQPTSGGRGAASIRAVGFIRDTCRSSYNETVETNQLMLVVDSFVFSYRTFTIYDLVFSFFTLHSSFS
jgi:hypothetical protein